MTLFSDYESVANVKIICQDGVLLTHKIVVASKNSFLKQLFSEIPVGDTITLFMPDYIQEEVEQTFCQLKSDSNSEVDLDHILLPVKEELTKLDNSIEDEEKGVDEYKPKTRKKSRNLTKSDHMDENEYDPLVQSSHADSEEDKIKNSHDDLETEDDDQVDRLDEMEQRSMINVALNYVPDPAPVIDTNLSYKEKSKIKTKIFELAKDYVKRG